MLHGWTRSTAAALARGQPDLVLVPGLPGRRRPDPPVVDGQLGRAVAAARAAPVTRPTSTRRVDPAGGPGPGRGRPPTPTPAQPVRYRIHPGVAEAARADAGPDLHRRRRHRNRRLLARRLCSHARRRARTRTLGWLVRPRRPLRRPLPAPPPPLGRPRHAAEQLLTRDTSTATAAALLPMLTAAVERHPRHRRDRTRRSAAPTPAPSPSRPRPGRRPCSASSSTTAVDRRDFGHRLDLASRPDQPLSRPRAGSTRPSPWPTRRSTTPAAPGSGPWTQLVDQALRLQILYRRATTSRSSTTGQQLRDQMAALPDPPDANDRRSPRVERPRDPAQHSWPARRPSSRQWQQALDLNAENPRLQAPPRRQRARPGLRPRSTTTGSLLRLGRTDRGPRPAAPAAAQVFEADNDIAHARQDPERARRRRETAWATATGPSTWNTTRCGSPTLAGDPDAIGVSHHNLADYLNADRRRPAAGRRAPARRRRHRLPDRQRHASPARLGGPRPAAAPTTRSAVPGRFAEVCADRRPGRRGAPGRAARPAPPPRPRPATPPSHDVLRLAAQAATDAEADQASADRPAGRRLGTGAVRPARRPPPPRPGHPRRRQRPPSTRPSTRLRGIPRLAAAGRRCSAASTPANATPTPCCTGLDDIDTRDRPTRPRPPHRHHRPRHRPRRLAHPHRQTPVAPTTPTRTAPTPDDDMQQFLTAADRRRRRRPRRPRRHPIRSSTRWRPTPTAPSLATALQQLINNPTSPPDTTGLDDDDQPLPHPPPSADQPAHTRHRPGDPMTDPTPCST